MLVTFSFTRVAATVRRWFEIGPDASMEHGARIELALREPQEHRGSESAAQRLVVDGVFWRADLFGRLDRPAEPFSAAHFHPWFEGVEPSDRHWDAGLTAAPWEWLAAQFADLGQRLAGAGLDPAVGGPDAEDVRDAAGDIVAAARRFGPDRPFTRDDDARLTKDAAHRHALMLDLVADPAALDREHLRPWLERTGWSG
ncbi:hypothetical protein ACR9E3_02310 [Actinomycetospora sp. C-140]